MHNYDALLHLSGGMDSAYVMWDYYRKNPKGDLLIHHVNLMHDKENRLYYERSAVKNILQWFKDKGCNFTYHESTFLYGSLPKITIKDIQIVAVFTAIICKTYGLIPERVLLPWHKGEVHQLGEKGIRVTSMLMALDAPLPKLEYPIEHLTRAEMFKSMPKDLLSLVWVCRRPENNQPCKKCKTCKEMIEAKIWKS